jgi:deoxycytidylate deaminase
MTIYMSDHNFITLPKRKIIDKFHNIIHILKKNASNSEISYKHAAAIINGTELCAVNVNKYIGSHLVYNIYGKDIVYHKTIHAEINVIGNSPGPKKNLKGLDIIVIRTNSHGVLCNSRPCNNCINKMNKIGIRKVYYSTQDGNIVYEFVKEMQLTHKSHGQKLLESLCQN